MGPGKPGLFKNALSRRDKHFLLIQSLPARPWGQGSPGCSKTLYLVEINTFTHPESPCSSLGPGKPGLFKNALSRRDKHFLLIQSLPARPCGQGSPGYSKTLYLVDINTFYSSRVSLLVPGAREARVVQKRFISSR